MAEAEQKIKNSQERLYKRLVKNANRKYAVLTCHIKFFEEQFAVIRKIQFEEGRGIKEIKDIEGLSKQLEKSVALPAVSGGKAMKDTQLMVSFALGGIGGLMIQDSKMNLQLASRNLSKANAVSAQADSICIVMDGIGNHVEIVSELLAKLGVLYMKSIKNLESILKTNGLNADKYSDQDIDAINWSFDLTKIIYRIINTPLIDKDGEVERESIRVIQDGEKLLDSAAYAEKSI